MSKGISNIIGDILDHVVGMFLRSLALDLDTFVNSFPFLATAYEIFQAIALGLILCIVAYQLSKFFFGQLAALRKTPILLLARGLIASALVFFGGHFLTLAVRLAQAPYDVMIDVTVPSSPPKFQLDWGDAAAHV